MMGAVTMLCRPALTKAYQISEIGSVFHSSRVSHYSFWQLIISGRDSHRSCCSGGGDTLNTRVILMISESPRSNFMRKASTVGQFGAVRWICLEIQPEVLCTVCTPKSSTNLFMDPIERTATTVPYLYHMAPMPTIQTTAG